MSDSAVGGAPTAVSRPSVDVDAAAALIAPIKAVPFSPWHLRLRIIVGSTTFFDAFDAVPLAFVLPVLVGLWHI